MNWANIKGLARDWAIAIVIVVVLWVVWVQVMAPSPRSSGPVPAFTLSDLTGQEIAHDTLEGVAILNFWFTSCPPCRHEIPELAAYHEAHPEVPLYGVSIDTMPTQRLAVMSRKLGVTYPVLHDVDARVAKAFGVSLFPTTVIVRDGQIVRVKTGEVDREGLEALVELVAEAEAPSAP